MSEQNVIEVIVVPEVPKVVSDEEIYVYVPIATNDTKGIVSFDEDSINVVAGVASVNDNYIKKLIDIEAQTIGDKKLDKLTTSGEYVYSHDGSVQSEILVSVSPDSNSIVRRNDDGNILVNDYPNDETVAINTRKLLSVINPVKEILQERTEVYLTKDEHGYVYINEVGGDD